MNTISDLAQRAAEAVDAERVINLTQELVRIRSVYEPDVGGNETQAAEYVAQVFRDMGLEPLLELAAPGRPNVICDWQGRGFIKGQSKTLMLEGHTDVVTEGDAESWTYPPFAAELVDGRIYGRGTADMKAGVAAAICAVEALIKTCPDLPGRIRFGIVSDEEGMMTGIKHFIEQGWAEEVDGAIICEPEEHEICLFQKGAMRVNVTVTGVMAHGAMPYAGVNPIASLVRFLSKVADYQQQEQDRLGAHPYLGLPWLTPTILKAPVKGEAQHNVMPERAYAALDIRTVPGQDHDEILRVLQGFAEEEKRVDERLRLELDLFESRPWTETPADDPLVKAIEAAYPQVLGTAPRYGGVPGATDGTFLHAWAAVPIVTIGPGERTVPHQRDEWVGAEDVVKAARLYAAAAVHYFYGNDKGE